MPLHPGARLGHYDVTAKLGEGGMGEVWEATDTKLNRQVALKILPVAFAAEPNRLVLFRREAQVLASLNHPNIAAIHGIEETDDGQALVLELVEGPTLADRIAQRPIPIDEALSIAKQIAEALEAAHEAGVIHRDLKPANIKVREDGTVKVLDFGLAKALNQRAESDPSGAPTITAAATAAGAVMGTAAYMAPEQARGKPVDQRADIWAFGVLLAEMLGGRRPFAGETLSDTLAAILRAEPDWSALPVETPSWLRLLLGRCTRRDPHARLRHIGDARLDIDEALSPAAASGLQGEVSSVPSRAAAPGRSRLSAWALIISGTVLGASLMGALDWWRGAAPGGAGPPRARFAIELADDEWLHDYTSASIDVSSDGTQIAYVANRGTERMIFVRRLDALEGQPVPGTERASSRTFSRDGEWLAFEAGGRLKKVNLSAGAPEFIAHLAFFVGADWGRNDIIVFTPSFMHGLYSVSATGGRPQRLTTPGADEAHLWPEVLPDGQQALFTVWSPEGNDQSSIGLVSLDTGEWRVVVESAYFGRYSPSGHLLYLRGSTLFAVPFDVDDGRIAGNARVVLEDVKTDAYNGAGFFAVSSTGSLVYASGMASTPARTLVWVDRLGQRSVITSTPRSYSSPRVSPDGERLALFLEDGAVVSVWTYALARESLTRVSFTSDDHNVAWSPDGRRIAFESGRDGVHQVFVASAEGSGDVEQVTSGAFDHYLSDWSSDGRTLAYVEFHPETGADLWTAELDGDREGRTFLNTPFYEKQATFSPDGRWLAYSSDESGHYEVYVRPYPGGEQRWLVSSGGGEEPAWSRSGQELYYRNGSRMMAVTVNETAEFTTTQPEVLFQGLFHYASFPSRTYDVAPDGRFVMVAEPGPEDATRRLEVILNWAEQLAGVVPTS